MKKLNRKWCIFKAGIKYKRLANFIPMNSKVLDIGTGNCAFARKLRSRGIDVTGLDIANKSKFSDFQPILFDGENIPFEDKSMDLVLLITVLHHTKNPEKLVDEAARVGGTLIIMEDIYSNFFQKQLTYFVDSLVNWEFKGHPHTNKTDDEWQALFRAKHFRIEHVEYYRFMLFFRQVTYLLIPDATDSKEA